MMRTRHNLPDNLNPTGDKCYPLFVPDDIQWNMYIIRAIRTLTFDRHWERDNNNGQDAMTVRRRWQDSTLQPLIDALENGDGCTDTGSGNCFRLYASNAGIQTLPNSPYEPIPDDIAELSQLGIWSTFESEIEKVPDWVQYLLDFFADTPDVMNNIGYGQQDIFISPPPESFDFDDSFAQFIDFFADLIAGDFPRIRIDLIGSGDVEIELLSVPGGGSAIVVVDDVFNFGDILNAILTQDASILSQVSIVELQRELIQLPPETVASVQIPLTLSGNENTPHNIKIFFLPRYDDELSNPVGTGGGFRRIDVCEGLRVINLDTDTEISIHNFGTQANMQRGFIMATTQEICDGMICAMEKVAQRILLASVEGNIKDDIEIDAKDLTVTTKMLTGSSGATLPDGLFDADAVIFGRAMALGEGFQDLVGEIILRRTTQARTAQNVANILRNTFYLRGLVDAIDLLADMLGTPYTNATDTVTPTVNPVDIASLAYCYGASQQTLYRYAQEIEDGGGTDAEDIANWYRLLIAEITQEQIDQWYDSGTSTPRLGYDTAPCYRVPPVQKILDYTDNCWNTALTNFFTGLPDSHLWNVSIRCLTEFVDANNNKFDGVYYTPDGGSPTLKVPTFADGTYNINYVVPFSGQLPIGDTYHAEMSRSTKYPNSIRFPLSNAWTKGSLEITLIDLGVL